MFFDDWTPCASNEIHKLMFHIFVGQVVEVPNVSWDAIGGLENVKRELQEVIGCTPL